MKDKDKVFIDSFRKNSLELVKVHLQKYHQQQYVDIRVFRVDEYGAHTHEEIFEGTPTKKGLTISVELLDRLVEALNRARLQLNGVSPGHEIDMGAENERH